MLQGSTANTESLISLSAKAHGLILPTHRSQLMPGGEYSNAIGRGMEHVESRKYAPGDSFRTIDWRVTARSGTVHTKVFEEDRKRTVHLIVDMRSSMRFGTRAAFKSVVAAEAASLIAWAAHHEGDPVSLIILSDNGLEKIPPASSTGKLLRLFNLLSERSVSPPDEKIENHKIKFSSIVKQVRSGDLAIVFSDMSELPGDVVNGLEFLNRRRFAIVCWILDKIEVQALPLGSYPVTNGEEFTTLRVISRQRMNELQAELDKRMERIEQTIKRLNVPVIKMKPGDSVVDEIYRVFHRGSRLRRFPKSRRGNYERTRNGSR